MKNIFLLIISGLLVISIKAQTNLEFSQTKLINLSGTPLMNQGDVLIDEEIIVIPQGKTWKIESAYASSKNDSGQLLFFGSPCYNSQYITMNDVLICNLETIQNNTNYEYFKITFPIWLPEGTYSFKLRGKTWCNYTTTSGFVSALEFNINE